MKPKIKVDEGLEMDMTTYKKVKGTLDPKTPIKITGDKPITSTSTMSVHEGDVIEPQDPATIKYLSNVKDEKTGEISKPFTLGGKNYQMIRGILPTKEVVMAVYCHDDLNEAGENIIHPVDYFDATIARPLKEKEDFDYAAAERDYHDKANMAVDEPKSTVSTTEQPKTENNSLKLNEFKHFLVNKKTGKVRKFKRAEELAKANMSTDETYMNLGQFKRHVDETLFGAKKSKIVNEETPLDSTTSGTNVDKLKTDVKKLVTTIKAKFNGYLTKIDKPIEQAEFITAMAAEIGVPANKLSSIIAQFKDIADTKPTATPVAESKIIKKDELIESLKKPVIKTVKIKDIK